MNTVSHVFGISSIALLGILLLLSLLLSTGENAAYAAQNCKAQINAVTGAVEVSASNVNGNPRLEYCS